MFGNYNYPKNCFMSQNNSNFNIINKVNDSKINIYYNDNNQLVNQTYNVVPNINGMYNIYESNYNLNLNSSTIKNLNSSATNTLGTNYVQENKIIKYLKVNYTNYIELLNKFFNINVNSIHNIWKHAFKIYIIGISRNLMLNNYLFQKIYIKNQSQNHFELYKYIQYIFPLSILSNICLYCQKSFLLNSFEINISKCTITYYSSNECGCVKNYAKFLNFYNLDINFQILFSELNLNAYFIDDMQLILKKQQKYVIFESNKNLCLSNLKSILTPLKPNVLKQKSKYQKINSNSICNILNL